jgi:hypothetical protein
MSSDLDRIVYLLNVENILYKTFGLFIIIISTIGNLCNCFVFLRIRALNKHPNALFFLGSSIGSLLFINIGLWPTITQIFFGINLLNQSLFWCKISAWLTYSSGCFSFMCNCFAAFGQFLITLPTMKWQRLITRFRAQLMILSTAIIWLLIFIPLPIYNHLIPTSSSTTFNCTNSISIMNEYLGYWIIIGYYFLPITLTFILFSLTWYNLQQLLRRRRTLDGAVTRMMLIQMSLILISGIPAGIDVCYLLSTQFIVKTPLRLVTEYLIFLILTLCTCLTNGISFWVYLFVSKTFRKHLKEFIFNSQLFKNRTRPIVIIANRININQ